MQQASEPRDPPDARLLPQAAGAWSGFAYLNGERVPANSGRMVIDRYFAVCLGKLELRLVADKNNPGLFAGNQPLNLARYRTRHVYAADSADDDRDEHHYEALFYINGVRYFIEALQFDGTMLDLRLIEPDGAVWTARAGYQFGERYPQAEPTRIYSPIPWEEYHVAL